MGGGLQPNIPPQSKSDALQARPLSVYLNPQKQDADTQRSLELFRAGTTTGAEAIKAAILINGGAAVALLAFISHLPPAVVARFAAPLGLFVGGVFTSALSGCATYFVHWCYVNKWNRGRWWVNLIAISLVAASLILFAVGCYCTFSAFKSGVVASTEAAKI